MLLTFVRRYSSTRTPAPAFTPLPSRKPMLGSRSVATTIRCNLIVVATERLPNIGFLEGSGVKAGAGVLVDEYLRTNVSNIYAAGDCAEVYDINRRESRINFGWRSAIKQGQLAGENLSLIHI